ncbi:MAG: pyrroline-5-carboxylate reductase [Pleomorphochaeta sp.]
MEKIGFIGLGNMGSSILRAVAKSNKFSSIAIFDTASFKVELLKDELSNDKLKIVSYNSYQSLIKNCEILMLCVKPQILSTIYSEIKSSNINNSLIISIAAGVNTSTLENELNSNRIVRFMPNLAAKCNKSVTSICGGIKTNDEDTQTAMEIAKTFGDAFFLEENLFSAFIGISGSAIAFVLEFAHALALGGTHEGIAYNKALDIVFATMESAKALYEVDRENPISLMSKVCSAGGTTIEGIKTLSDYNFSSAVINSVVNTTKKSQDLEKK